MGRLVGFLFLLSFFLCFSSFFLSCPRASWTSPCARARVRGRARWFARLGASRRRGKERLEKSWLVLISRPRLLVPWDSGAMGGGFAWTRCGFLWLWKKFEKKKKKKKKK